MFYKSRKSIKLIWFFFSIKIRFVSIRRTLQTVQVWLPLQIHSLETPLPLSTPSVEFCYATKIVTDTEYDCVFYVGLYFVSCTLKRAHLAAARTCCQTSTDCNCNCNFVAIAAKLQLNRPDFFFLITPLPPRALCIFITFFFCPLISHQGVCVEER